MLQSFPDFNVEMYILDNKFHKSNILEKVSAYLQPYAEERDFSHFNIRIYIYELDERTLTLATDLSLFLTKALRFALGGCSWITSCQLKMTTLPQILPLLPFLNHEQYRYIT